MIYPSFIYLNNTGRPVTEQEACHILSNSGEQNFPLHIPNAHNQRTWRVVFWGEEPECGTTSNLLAVEGYLKSYDRQAGHSIKFTDLGRKAGLLTEEILKEADLLVINLKQTPESFDAFFEKHIRISPKCMFLVSSYQKESIYNKKRLRHLYRIPERQIGVIPYNPEFQSACEKGRISDYVTGKSDLYISEARRYFMQELAAATELLLEKYNQTEGELFYGTDY